MNGRQRRKLFAGAGLITMLLGALLTLAPSGALASDFPGDCTATTSTSGTCTIAQPEGSQATHGTATYSRTGDVISFNLATNETITELQVCMAVAAVESTNPYTPTAANTCSGNNTSGTTRVLQVPGPLATPYQFQIDLTTAGITGFTAGAPIYFALHINTAGQTTYIVGGAGGGTTQPQYGSFTIEKDFDGDLAPADDPSFTIEIACANGQTPIDLNGNDAGNSTTVQVKESDNPIWSSTSLGVQLPQGSTCLIEETPVPADVEVVSYKIDGVDATRNAEDQITVTIGSAVKAVLITNDYGDRQPGTGDLTVSKVAGTNPPNPSPTFSFTVDCEEGDPIDLNGAETAGTQASFNLTFGQSKSFEGLPEGATCDVVETVDGNATSTTHKVNGGDNVNSKAAADVAITDGGNATVAFTNNFPGTTPGCIDNPNTPLDECNFVPPPGCVDDAATAADECNPEPPEVITDVCPQTPGRQTMIESCVEVLPDEQERPPVVTPPAPPVETPPQATPPAPEVKGDVVARTLPRTGNESGDLAAFGAALLLLGAGLVLTSRSRFARVD